MKVREKEALYTAEDYAAIHRPKIKKESRAGRIRASEEAHDIIARVARSTGLHKEEAKAVVMGKLYNGELPVNGARYRVRPNLALTRPKAAAMARRIAKVLHDEKLVGRACGAYWEYVDEAELRRAIVKGIKDYLEAAK